MLSQASEPVCLSVCLSAANLPAAIASLELLDAKGRLSKLKLSQASTFFRRRTTSSPDPPPPPVSLASVRYGDQSSLLLASAAAALAAASASGALLSALGCQAGDCWPV